MKPKRICFFFFLMLTVFFISTANSAPWDMSKRLNRVLTTYNINNIERVSGVIEKIYDKVPSNFPNKYTYGFHCILKTEKETIDIHLGPTWYIKSLDGKIAVGDTVQIVGSGSKGHATDNGEVGIREILAAEVRKDGVVVLKLRDKDGTPLWSGH